MREELLNLLRELNAILSALRRAAASSLVGFSVSERIQELVLTWSTSIRPSLLAIGVPKEVLDRADGLTLKLARLAMQSTPNRKVSPAVSAVRETLLRQILPELGRISPLNYALFVRPAPAPLFPEIPDLPNQLVPYAVQGWSDRIKTFLRNNPFGKNVFIMVAYRARLEPLISAVENELVNLDLNPVLARDHSLTNDLYNPIACLLCCSYGVAIFDRAETAQMHNPNVVYELGMMQLLKRNCIILKHRKLKRMPTDLLSMLYEDYDSQRLAVERLRAWWARVNT